MLLRVAGPIQHPLASLSVLVLNCLERCVQENYTNYDKGVLAEILEPIMGKGLIPAGGCRLHPSGGQPWLSSGLVCGALDAMRS